MVYPYDTGPGGGMQARFMRKAARGGAAKGQRFSVFFKV